MEEEEEEEGAGRKIERAAFQNREWGILVRCCCCRRHNHLNQAPTRCGERGTGGGGKRRTVCTGGEEWGGGGRGRGTNSFPNFTCGFRYNIHLFALSKMERRNGNRDISATRKDGSRKVIQITYYFKLRRSVSKVRSSVSIEFYSSRSTTTGEMIKYT